MQNVNNNGINKLGLFCEISNKKNKNGDYIILIEEDSYLTLKNDKTSFALLKEQGFINFGEIIIFLVKIRENQIELINCIDRCYNCLQMKKFYEKINSLNYKLWKVIKKNNDSYNLKENDIFRFGNVKIILREFNIINNENSNNNNSNKERDYNNDVYKKEKDFNDNQKKENSHSLSVTYYPEYKIISDKRQYGILLESNPGKICDICGKSDKDKKGDDPLVQFCECEKYEHFKCKKKKMKGDKNISIVNENKTQFAIKLETDCPKCKKFIHSSFITKEGNKYKLFELMSPEVNKNVNYLLFETIDYLDKNKKYIKYIFYVELNEQKNFKNNYSILMRGDETKKQYKCDKIFNIEGEKDKISEIFIIDVDLKEKNLILKNISNEYDILVLQDNIKINPNDKLLLESGDLTIKSSLMGEDEFDGVKRRMENNPDKIEIRKNSK